MTTPTASLSVHKILSCTPAEAFHAWTVPELFQQWFVPAPGVRATATMDVRKGGRYEIQFHRPSKPAPLVVRGEFLAVVPPRYLEYTWLWSWDENPTTINHSVVKVAFEPLGTTQTEVTLVHEGFADPEDQQGHSNGWTSILNGMAASFLAKGKSY
jgi:uncharacterized protein YndB with AHSA1/START domain